MKIYVNLTFERNKQKNRFSLQQQFLSSFHAGLYFLSSKFFAHLNYNASEYCSKSIVFAPPSSTSQHSCSLPIFSNFDPQINLNIT